MGSSYVVTGCNRGLGLEFARQLARRGDRVIATARRPEEAEELDELAGIFEVNSFGALRVTRALLPHLRLGDRKVVANISSMMGSIGDNSSGEAYGYRGSKAALNMLTRSLAIDRLTIEKTGLFLDYAGQSVPW